MKRRKSWQKATVRQRFSLLLGSLLWLAVLLMLAIPAIAQIGGNFSLTWSSADGGGNQGTSGGNFRLSGAVGQPDAQTVSGGNFRVDGGFWSVPASTLVPTQTPGGATATPVPPSNTPTRTPIPSNTPIPPSSTPVPPSNTTAPTNTRPPTQTPGGPSATPMPSNTPTSILPSSTPVPSTQTPGGPSATPVPSHTRTSTPVAQPSATPTQGLCLIEFADVTSTNTFFLNVMCLACRGIDTGFPCGGPGEPCNSPNQRYFRPNSEIKRDDLAHMVAASAGFIEDPGPRRFQDVPTTNPYYDWVQRMANRNLIGGYPCGSPGEPCVAPGNLAYYRPQANATRGQIAKIVSNGAGFEDPPIGQVFEDVPPTNAFYIWIQRLTSRGVMGGYPCGRVGEPCGDDNKPYFRWGNNSTRGQVAKITANTFYPNCALVLPTSTPTRPVPSATNTPVRPPSSTPTRRPPTSTPTPCAINTNYTIGRSANATLVPGSVLVPDSRCDDCTPLITLPFRYRLYGREFSTVRASENGTLQFDSNVASGVNSCLPAPSLSYSILAYWDDLLTTSAGKGIYTSVSGSAPNRIFNIEWRAIYRDFTTQQTNFEVRLYENPAMGRFDVIYARVDRKGRSATVGVQKSGLAGGLYTQLACNAGGLTSDLLPGTKLAFTQPGCLTP